ncbi:hypothetical protein PV08_08306 [Exophiala spinifera]|uniref:Uncharacterized protein n=1 Tax=Exophiala spinifera TaxID=91928 RepID=A0A0D2BPS4_9EURO|nr:uncharacterized protein PV08_08306 [Exophiala spinifera]KIW13119.1 hypothetical protein PV08_08306 [Exophiala spinifera]
MALKGVTRTFYSAVGSTQTLWQPSSSYYPLSGFGALLLSSAGVIVSAIILLVSNGDDINSWRFQPTVYLSIASTVTNITVVYALFEGLTITWWHQALKDGTTIGDLHRIWAFGNSILAAVFSGRNINMVAIASMFVALCPINGPLLQRASTLGNATIPSQQPLNIPVKQLVPRGYTGIISGRGDQVSMLTSNFSTTARAYYARSPITYDTDCKGSCRTKVLGAGFHVSCSSSEYPYNVSGNLASSPTIFGAWVDFDVSDNPVSFNLNVQTKPEAGCTGNLAVTNCTLTAGTVDYPIAIDGDAGTVSLEPGTTIWDDTVVGDLDALSAETHQTAVSTYGGIFLALSNQYSTDLQLHFGGAIGWEFYGAQSESSVAYARGVGDYPSCDVHFTDPLPDFLQGSRELMFRTAIAAANSSDMQSVVADASGFHTVYQTSYLFLALATLASALAILSVLLTFNGFWRIGRKVSLSPIETGKAFNASMLREGDSSAPAKILLAQVGGKAVKYGLVKDPEGIESVPAATKGHHENSHGNTSSNNVLTTSSSFRDMPSSDIELTNIGGYHTNTVAHLELADPKRVVPL